MVGRREFRRVGPAFLKGLEFREILLEFWEHFGNEEKVYCTYFN